MTIDPYPLEPDEPTPAAPPVVVGAGFACRRCGYDLRGLPERGQCPECGAPVIRSLRGNMLELADPRYLRRLEIGALMVELGVVAICAVPIGGAGYFLLMAMVPSLERMERLLPLLAALLAIGAGVLGLLGWLVLTERDPAHIGADESDTARLTTRIATIVCSACWGFSAIISATPTIAAVAPARFSFLLTIAGVALAAGVWVQAIASMSYLRHLAARIPDAWLVGDLISTRALAVAGAAATALTAIFAMNPGFSCGAGVTAVIGFLLTLVFFVKYADVVDRMRRRTGMMGVMALAAERAANTDA